MAVIFTCAGSTNVCFVLNNLRDVVILKNSSRFLFFLKNLYVFDRLSIVFVLTPFSKKKLDLAKLLLDSFTKKFRSKIFFFNVYLFCFITKNGLYVIFLCTAVLPVGAKRHLNKYS